jgi:4a-hydroxytetrahydrobiopterin dehydratase
MTGKAPAPAPLTAAQLATAALALPEWTCTEAALTRTFTFPDFPAAIAFMADCAPGIQERDHHPEWTNVYDRIEVRLNTHEAKGKVTGRDVEIAKFLDWKFSTI